MRRIQQADLIGNLARDPQLLASLLDSAPVMITYKSRALIYKYVNKTFADWVGLPPDRIIGRHTTEIRDPQEFEMMRPQREAVIAGETVRQGSVREIAGKGARYLISTMVPHKDEQDTVVGYFSFVQDVTDLKMTEHALARQQEQLRLVIDSVPVLISYRDRNLVFRYGNRTHEAWYGISPEDLVGRHISEIVSLDVFHKIKPHIDRALAGETVHFEQSVDYPKCGTRQVLVSYVPHEDATGRVVGLFTLVQDVTKLSGARPASTGGKRRVERESVLKSESRPA